MQVTRQKNRYRGLAIVETAIIFPILLLITLGAVHFGWLFLKAQQVTHAAREGARAAIRADAVNDDVGAIIEAVMAKAGMPKAQSGYTWTPDPTDVYGVLPGDPVRVKVEVPGQKVALFHVNLPLLGPWLDLTPLYLRGAVTMSKEGS